MIYQFLAGMGAWFYFEMGHLHALYCLALSGILILLSWSRWPSGRRIYREGPHVFGSDVFGPDNLQAGNRVSYGGFTPRTAVTQIQKTQLAKAIEESTHSLPRH